MTDIKPQHFSHPLMIGISLKLLAYSCCSCTSQTEHYLSFRDSWQISQMQCGENATYSAFLKKCNASCVWVSFNLHNILLTASSIDTIWSFFPHTIPFPSSSTIFSLKFEVILTSDSPFTSFTKWEVNYNLSLHWNYMFYEFQYLTFSYLFNI